MATIESLRPGAWTLLGRAPFNVRGDAIFVSSTQQPDIAAPGLRLGLGSAFDFIGSDYIWAKPVIGGNGKAILSPVLDDAERVTTSFFFRDDVLSGEAFAADGVVENIAIRAFFNTSTAPYLAMTDEAGRWSIELASSTNVVSSFRLEIDASRAVSEPTGVSATAGLILDLNLAVGVVGPAWM